MKYSDEGLELTEHFEGCEFKAYQDGGGVWTIGVGHTKGVKQGMTCTHDQAMQWLREDVEEAEDAVADLVKVPLNQNQYDALVDFVFNLGRTQFAGSTLLRLLNLGKVIEAARQFPRWNKDNGRVIAGLTRRREAEQELFLRGLS